MMNKVYYSCDPPKRNYIVSSIGKELNRHKMKGYQISVVIPTYNRAERIKETLEALEKQTLKKEDFEIIVIDDGSDDNTQNTILTIKKRTNYAIRLFTQSNKGSASARNYGIQKAMSNVILSMDDDMVACAHLLALHAEFHKKYPEKEAVLTGSILTGEDGIDLCNPDYLRSPDVQINNKWYRIKDFHLFCTQNASFKKEFVTEAGFFTGGLMRYDDVELASRLNDQGLLLYYCPKAISIHREPVNSLAKVIHEGKRNGRVLAEWHGKLPFFNIKKHNFGARFNRGLSFFLIHPLTYLKDLIRRWIVNKITIKFILLIISRMTVTQPPKKLLVYLCREVKTYYLRREFYTNKKHSQND